MTAYSTYSPYTYWRIAAFIAFTVFVVVSNAVLADDRVSGASGSSGFALVSFIPFFAGFAGGAYLSRKANAGSTHSLCAVSEWSAVRRDRQFRKRSTCSPAVVRLRRFVTMRGGIPMG